MILVPLTRTSGFGVLSVMGTSLLPNPAAINTALLTRYGSSADRPAAVSLPSAIQPASPAVAFLANVSHMPLALLISDFDTQMLVECAALVSIVIFAVNVIGKVVFALVKRALAR